MLLCVGYDKTISTRGKWLFLCDCGKTKSGTSYNWRTGAIKSCGCKKFISDRSHLINVCRDTSFISLYRSYKKGAKSRGYDFELSKDFFRLITKKNCHYCGVTPSRERSARMKNGKGFYIGYIYNGIDRKDNSIGYLENNCLPCCTICNTAKKDLSYNEFIEYLKRVINFNLTNRF